jgi:hypothetical protein
VSFERHLPSMIAADPIVRLVVVHWILGAVFGIVSAVILIGFDFAGLRGLVVQGDHIVWEAIVLLLGGFAITFGGVISAGAVMLIPDHNN